MSPTPGRPERPTISEKPPWRRSNVSPDAADPGTPRATHDLREAALRRSPRAAAEIDHGSFDSLSEPARGSGVALRSRATAAAAVRTSAPMSPTPERPERPTISEKPPCRRSNVSPDAADPGTPRTTHEPREAALRRSPRAAAEIDHGSFDSLSEPARGSGVALRCRATAPAAVRTSAPTPPTPRNAPSDPRSPKSRPGTDRRRRAVTAEPYSPAPHPPRTASAAPTPPRARARSATPRGPSPGGATTGSLAPGGAP
jgi:hypothetical protein